MSAPDGMTRHQRAAGPYRYTYADPASVGPVAPFQLEFWISGKRKGSGAWTLSHAAPIMPGGYRAWRKVRKFHSHADRLAHSIGAVRSCGYALSVERQTEAYLELARVARWPRVHVFKGDGYARAAARAIGFEVVEVDPAEFTGPAPAPEIDTEAYL